MVSTKVVSKAARVVSRVVVAVAVPNSKIRTQTVVEVYGTTSKTIRGTINDKHEACVGLSIVAVCLDSNRKYSPSC